MSEPENEKNVPVVPAEPVDAQAAQAASPPSPPPEGPAAAEKTRWRDHAFRLRSVAAVAVAGVIIGAAGGAVTTALVSDDRHGDHERPRFGQVWQPGMPVVPPGGRLGFPGGPGDRSEDGELPEMPVPPGASDGTEDGTDDSTDNGADDESSASQS